MQPQEIAAPSARNDGGDLKGIPLKERTPRRATFTVVPGSRKSPTWLVMAAFEGDDRKGRPYAERIVCFH